MKKAMLILGLIITTEMSAHGFTTCVKSNTYIGILKKNTDGTSAQYDNTTKTWEVVYDYTTLTGFASCNDISGTANTPKTNLVTGSADTGTHCWCEMWPVTDYGYETGPTSYWVYLKTYNSESDCGANVNGCTASCAEAMRDDDTFRTAVFESMW